MDRRYRRPDESQPTDRWPWALALGFLLGVLVMFALVWLGNHELQLAEATRVLSQLR